MFHANSKPIKDKYSWRIENEGGGLLKIEVPIGLYSEMVLEGGIGRRWIVGNINYPPRKAVLDNAKSKALDAGEWRLELPIDASKEKQTNVTIITIGEKNMKKILRPSIAIERYWGVAVLANEDAIIIPRGDVIMPSFINLSDFKGKPIKRVFIAENKNKLASVGHVKVGIEGKQFTGALSFCSNKAVIFDSVN